MTALPTTRHELGLLWRARPGMAGLLLAGQGLARLPGPAIRKVPGIGWVTGDPVVAREVLKDHRSFTMVGEGGVGDLWAQILGEWVRDLFDGPGHHDLRTRARDLFTEETAAGLVAKAWGPVLGDAGARLADGEPVDIAHLARVLVGRMMIELLGIPAPDGRSESTPWPDDDGALTAFRTGERLARLALGTAGSTTLPPAAIAEAKLITDELTTGVPHAFRTAPTTRLLGRARELGLGLEETTGLASLLMVAGTETSASAMTRTAALLVDTGEQHRLLAALGAGAAGGTVAGDGPAGAERPPSDINLWEPVVREGLRVTSPASVIGRGVSRDVTIGGTRLRAGDRIMLLVWSANAAVGPFRADREYVRETRQLWFGAGRHLCLGAALARAEIAALLRVLWPEDDAVPLRVVRRRAARRVIVPGYEELVLARS
ncbi:cytochrome P450 [Myceligenerans xiligouense]|uniref:Cytochrome P450 n=1 Tax=Myceligenerans xiligouense TaxID=253184 RepID=A0A3N4ZHD3_9MICO|nr:cytochrome P450 [Myceligenerans xiligouense]RPF20275.1 cytochrome P450 [Myceligenerans xiligouense]